MNEVLIKVDNVSKKFCRDLKKSLWYGVKDVVGEISGRGMSCDELRPGEFWSTDDISFELKRGECLGLIGPNGAGKSTLLKMLNGLIKPDKGQIRIHGRVAALIELGAGFNPILTGRENICVNGAVLGFTKDEIARKFDEIVEFAELGEFIDTPVQNYSSGMKVRLGFAVAAQMEPDVLIIDEVLAVGDTGFRIKCLNRIHELLNNSAVIFVSHAMPYVARICTHVMLMRKGVSIHYSPMVSEGIDLYNKGFESGKKSIAGTGEVEVSAVSINDEIEGILPIIPFGGRVQVKMALRVHTNCHSIGIRILVSNVDQRPVIDVVSEDYDSFLWENESESVTLIADIPPLHLAQGRHDLAIVIYDNETKSVLCRINNAASFVMGHHISSGSDSFVAAHWRKINRT